VRTDIKYNKLRILKLNTLMTKLLKNSPTKYSSVLINSPTIINRDMVPMDEPIFNIAFSGDLDGGLVSGLTLLAGPTKTFKTKILLACLRAYLNRYSEACAILYDSEGGITPDYLMSENIDPNRVLHVPIEHIEMLKFDMVKQLEGIERGERVFIGIDSIGNTASKKELQDALDEKSTVDMTRAKALKGLTRMITPMLVNKDVPCVAVCHTYETMELYSKSVISGGTGIIYSAHQAFIIGKRQEKDGDDLVGWSFVLNVEKSRFVREKAKFVFKVLYDSGIQKYSGLMEIALESGLVVKATVQSYKRMIGDVLEDKNWKLKNTECAEFWEPILADERFKEFVRRRYKLLGNSYGMESNEGTQ